VRVIKGTLKQMLANPIPPAQRVDYIMADLQDEGVLLDPMDRLRELYPNIMGITRTNQATGHSFLSSGVAHEEATEQSLFEDFYYQMTDRNLVVRKPICSRL